MDQLDLNRSGAKSAQNDRPHNRVKTFTEDQADGSQHLADQEFE